MQNTLCPSAVKVLCATILMLFIARVADAGAAERLPLMDFLRDVRQQLLSFEQQSGDYAFPAMIKNVHVEMHVAVDKDEQGRTVYYVIEGLPEQSDVVTQKLSFDLELHSAVDSMPRGKRYRTYSTRKSENAFQQRGYGPGRQYPYPPAHYMPEIYPVIQYERKR